MSSDPSGGLGALWQLPDDLDIHQPSAGPLALLEVGILLIEVLLDGLGFKSDSERRAEIENQVSAIRRRYLNEAGTGDQLESADELDEAAPGLVGDLLSNAHHESPGQMKRRSHDYLAHPH